MTPKLFMVIAGETSGDILAAELVTELRSGIKRIPTYTNDPQPLEADLAPRFFGAGGPRMAATGVELAFDMTSLSVVGLLEVIKKYGAFKQRFDALFRLAVQRQPNAIICVDFYEFNRRFARAVKKYVRARRGPFHDWNPRIIQYVSPQVWASRPGRANKMANDCDLLLSIIPFEKDWYARRAPKMRVEFVGHPILDRDPGEKLMAGELSVDRKTPSGQSTLNSPSNNQPPSLLLLPGSRLAELERHLPVMLDALKIIRSALPGVVAKMILPNEQLAAVARTAASAASAGDLTVLIGGVAEALSNTTVAIAKTGTVSMECAYFGVPTVTLYKTSSITYRCAKPFVTVGSLTMPNLLAGQAIFPEFIQNTATGENIARAALELLRDDSRRARVKAQLKEIVASLGEPGASRRAADAIIKLL